MIFLIVKKFIIRLRNTPPINNIIGSATKAYRRYADLEREIFDCGDHQRLLEGCFENYLKVEIRDCGLSKICAGLEAFSSYDLLASNRSTFEHFSMMKYAVREIASLHYHFAIPCARGSRPYFELPRGYLLHQATKKQASILHDLKDTMPIFQIQLLDGSGMKLITFSQYLCLIIEEYMSNGTIPLNAEGTNLNATCTPLTHLNNPHLLKENEKEQITWLTRLFLMYGLSFRQERVEIEPNSRFSKNSADYVYKISPSLEDVSHSDFYRKGYTIKQYLSRKIDFERIKKNSAHSKSNNIGKSATAVTPSKKRMLADCVTAAEAAKCSPAFIPKRVDSVKKVYFLCT